MDRTNAKRQARHRARMTSAGEHKRINYWVPLEVHDRVGSYAHALGWQKRKVLETMINGYRMPRVWLRITKKSRRGELRDKSAA